MKRTVSLLLAAAVGVCGAGGLVGCGGDDGNAISIWAPTAAIAGYESLVPAFKEAYPQYAQYNFVFTARDEGDVRTALSSDASAGADIFFFQSGDIQSMMAAQYLEPLDVGDDRTLTEKIKARDAESAWAPVMKDGVAMAFPATADNGWFLWYDNTVFDEDDVASLDTMLEKLPAGKKILMNYGSAWYGSAFFFGVGCRSDYDAAGTAGSYSIDFDGEKGRAAALSLQQYLSTGKIVSATSDSANNDECINGFADGSVVAFFNGTWVGDSLMKKLGITSWEGSRVSMTKAPTFKATIDGTERDYQMTIFTGGKYCGVNSQKKDAAKIEACVAFADFMTDENGQAVRFRTSKAGPSNKAVASSAEVKADPALAALSLQASVGGYTQLKQPEEFWTQLASYAKGCYAKTVTADNYVSKLNACIALIRENA